MNICNENIKKIRIERGWSQEELAEKAGFKSRSSICHIESGKADLTQTQIVRFAKAFGVDPAEIIGIAKSLEAKDTNKMELKDIIREYREVHGISLREFSRRSELSGSYILLLEQGGQNGKPISPTMKTYEKLAKAMCMKSEDLIAKVKGAKEKDAGEVELLGIYESLNSDYKSRLLEYARFIGEQMRK